MGWAATKLTNRFLPPASKTGGKIPTVKFLPLKVHPHLSDVHPHISGLSPFELGNRTWFFRNCTGANGGKGCCLVVRKRNIENGWEKTLKNHANLTSLKINIARWKITSANRRYIFKWSFFHCHLSFSGCTPPSATLSANSRPY